MKKCLVAMFLFVSMIAAVGCSSLANPEQCQNACNNELKLSKAQAEPAAEDPAQKIENDFTVQIQALDVQQAEAMKALDDEMNGKIVDGITEEAKDALKADYAKTKEAKGNEFAAKLADIQKAKQEALTALQAQQAEAAEAQRVKDEKAVSDCAANCQKATSPTKAVCQAAATSMDQFNACK